MVLRWVILALFIGILVEASTDNCQLSKDLKDEIQSYKPVVNRIIESIVNGEFKGDTYRR